MDEEIIGSACKYGYRNFIGSDEKISIFQKITDNFLGVGGIDNIIGPVMEPIEKFSEPGKFVFPVANRDIQAFLRNASKVCRKSSWRYNYRKID